MSDQLPPPPPLSSVPVFTDRSTGLKIFGVLEILLGCLFALFVMLIPLAQTMAGRAGQPPTPMRMMVPSLVMYGGLAILFLFLGVGSFQRQRWACALTRVTMWSWLVVGVFTTVLYAFILPTMFRSMGMPKGPAVIGIVVALAVLLIVLIVVPTVFVVFYQRSDVKATCEARHPNPAWTDACPLPLLALSLWMWTGAAMMFAMPLAGMAVLPFFGTMVAGGAGVAAFVVFGIVWAWAGWALYRMQTAGWWATLVVLIFFSISATVTFLRVDIMEMYELMGYNDQQIAMISRFNFMSGKSIAFMCLGWLLPFLGFLVYSKRYFPRTDGVDHRPAQP